MGGAQLPTMGGASLPGAGQADQVPSPRETELEGRLQEMTSQLQRMAADFENFRRRASQEREELIRFAAQRLVENLLPVIDNFERAVAHAQQADPAAFQQGVTMIHRQLMDTLRQQGVEAMTPVGSPFDPRMHEAVGNVETTEYPDGSVVAVLQPGYTLSGKVVRPAMVQIASNPTPAAAPAAASEQEAPTEQAADITLEELMAEATVTESTKEDAHG